jgi:bifunctional aspartokinase / homoserine dehydrogenase 1
MSDLLTCDTHKFGGTSLADSACFERVAEILTGQRGVVVVSAVGETTAKLQQILDVAASGDNYDGFFNELERITDTLIASLLPSDAAATLMQKLQDDREHLQGILSTVQFAQHYDKSLQDIVLGFGEIWSASILTAYLCNSGRRACFLDASSVLVLQDGVADGALDWAESERRMLDFMAGSTDFELIIATGFIAADHEGHRVTLGVNSSDYSAAIFASLCHSQTLTIWTDVDGVMSANPTQVPSAFVLESLSYKEALELAYFGASVIHPLAIPLVMQHQIALYIKNSFKPELPGTAILTQRTGDDSPVKGLTSISEMALLSIEGAGMIGVSGIAARAFTALHQKKISVVLISQASSEYSICLAVRHADIKSAYKVLTQAFSTDLQSGHVDKIRMDLDCAIVAVVGDGMIGRPGIAARLCEALSSSRINIRAIAQGSSERNVSIVVQERDLSRALRTIHSAYHLSNKTLSIGLIGPGQIGTTLLAQLAQEEKKLLDQFGVSIKLRGLMNSKNMVLDEFGLPLDDWSDAIKNSLTSADMIGFMDHVRSDHIPHSVLIDMTASQNIADCYHDAVHRGMHIITPNKRANSGDMQDYQSLRQVLNANNRHYLYEATVCAGLPVIKTIRDILNTGDRVQSITGVFSGTLGYIMGQVSKGCSFSSAVQMAHEKGYTEPDPREDLSGMDVARKTICLAREMGLQVSVDDLQIDSLVPEALRQVSCQEFLEQLSQYDDDIAAMLLEKSGDMAGVHYVGQIDASGKVGVGLLPYTKDHALAGLEDTDNIVIIHTDNYSHRPLVIQGPGAGAAVTASGVFADLLRLVAQL